MTIYHPNYNQNTRKIFIIKYLNTHISRERDSIIPIIFVVAFGNDSSTWEALNVTIQDYLESLILVGIDKKGNK